MKEKDNHKKRGEMSLIQLKNVSKYYYSKGMIASGISKVNLTLDIGEFVVITGESGSGKSTLLNVLSGLDSYEDGEMYIDGRETSHFLASDFEEYRKKYIGNIFQKFHLVNSYTVYQNIELILLINGYSKKDIKPRVEKIIRRVGLEKFAKKKVSKLSGGQKQRVAIARALAKDTNIIVADEPTGNLDSVSAEGIVKLLSEIAQDKLVIVVTHNYEQFAPYTTRKIKMHDGKIVEDAVIRPRKNCETQLLQEETAGSRTRRNHENMTVCSKLKLGFRNTFNLFYKFILLLLVFVFVVFAVTAEYSSFQHQKREAEMVGYNDYFYNYSENRSVLKKVDGSQFTPEDLHEIRQTENVKSVAPYDILLDNSIYIEDENLSCEAYPRVWEEFDGKLIAGRMPEKADEVILTGYKDDYYFSEGMTEDLLDKKYIAYTYDGNEMEVVVVGLAYKEGEENFYIYGGDVFLSGELMSDLMKDRYIYSSEINITINGKIQQSDPWGGLYSIMASKNVETGNIMVPEDVNSFYDTDYSEGSANGKDISIGIKNIHFSKSLELTVSDVYTERDFQSKTGYQDYDTYGGTVFISSQDYDKLFRQGNYQITVYVEDANDMKETMKALKRAGYITLPLKDMLMFEDSDMLSVVQVPIAVVIVLALFFIAYFVIRLILKSRAGYFSILRMLGLARKSIRRIMDVELFLVANIAFFTFIAFMEMVSRGVIDVEYIITLAEYIRAQDLLVLYVVLMAMTYLISGKFSKSLFKKTALGTYREEE